MAMVKRYSHLAEGRKIRKNPAIWPLSARGTVQQPSAVSFYREPAREALEELVIQAEPFSNLGPQYLHRYCRRPLDNLVALDDCHFQLTKCRLEMPRLSASRVAASALRTTVTWYDGRRFPSLRIVRRTGGSMRR